MADTRIAENGNRRIAENGDVRIVEAAAQGSQSCGSVVGTNSGVIRR